MQPHVLVVEDEDALAELLQYNLKKEGFRVSMAADGEEAERLRGVELGRAGVRDCV